MTAPMIRLKVNFVPEEQLAYLTIVQGEGAGAEDLAYMGFGADGLSGVISLLADVRAQFAQKVPDDPPAETAETVNPGWQLAPEPTAEGACLRLRHPGLGWLGFVIPPSQADHIRRLLGERLEAIKK